MRKGSTGNHRFAGPMAERIELYSIPEPNSGCWLWLNRVNGAGYGDIGAGKSAHRASYSAFVGPIPAGIHVLHKCDQPSCVNPDHLFLGTQQDNMDDRSRKGRTHSKLSKTQADAIRTRARAGEAHALIASAYGITARSVSDIKCGRTWKT